MYVIRFFVILIAVIDILLQSKGVFRGSIGEKKRFGRYLRAKLETLGPVFVKLGQMLSVRFDLLPAEICQELQGLLNKETPYNTDIAIRVIENELGKPIKKIFPEFNTKPIAAASIGQVYKAKLIGGEKVIVKVLRPNAKRIVKRDLTLFTLVVAIVDLHPVAHYLRLNQILQEFKQWTIKEVDYRNELKNIQAFEHAFKDDKDLRIPHPYEEYSTDSVLTMEYVPGTTLATVIDKYDPHTGVFMFDGRKVKMTALVERLAKILSKQSLEVGLFHADPHPANIIVDKDLKVCLVDFGIIGHLDPVMMKNLREALIAVSNGDADTLIDLAIKIDQSHGDEKFERLRTELTEFIATYARTSISETSFTEFASKLLFIGGRNGIQWPISLVMFVKQIVTLDGIALKLAPEINIIKFFVPFAQKLSVEELADHFSDEKLYTQAISVAQALVEFPSVVTKLSDAAQKMIETQNHIEAELAKPDKEEISPLWYLLIIPITVAGVIYINNLNSLDQISLISIWLIVIMMVTALIYIILKKIQ